MTLLQYLGRRYLAIVALLVVVFTFLVSFMNLSGMDDTTEYYMHYEAQVLSEYYQRNDKIIEFDAQRKEYYWGDEQLPSRYQQLIADQPLLNQKASLYQLDTQYVYILAYYLASMDINFYVIHLFDDDNYMQSNRVFKGQIFAFSMIALLLIILLMLYWHRVVARQVNHFDSWVKNIVDLPSNQVATSQLPEDVFFEELIATANTLQHSLIKQHQLQAKEQVRMVREKSFLSSLSHELRTPIAVIAAATALLTKRNELSDKDRKTIDKLAKANGNMKLLTNTLLQVWRKQSAKQPKQLVSLAQLVTLTLGDEQVRRDDSISFDIKVKSTQTLLLDVTLVKIVMSNLLRNAGQYSADGRVLVEIDKDRFFVANQYSANQYQTHEPQQYGFGFGLYLIETICEQQCWAIEVKTETGCFSVGISL